MRLSYSKITDFEKCKYSFYLSNIKKVPFVSNSYLEDGKNIHKILEESVKSSDWKKFLLTHQYYLKYQLMIDNFIKFQENIIKAKGNPIPKYSEIKLYDKDLDFSLVIDSVIYYEDKILIMDFKSDGTKVKGKHDKQLILYSYFYDKLQHPESIDKIHYGPLFLKHESNIIAKKISEKEITETLNWLVKLKNEIEEYGDDETKYTKKPTGLCRFCSHRTMGYCEGKTTTQEIEITEVFE